MDGKVKSRGRRSLVKRHRGSRLSGPVPAARLAVTAIWTLSEALFLATADQASGRCRRWKNRLAAMDRESDRTGRRETRIVPHTDLGGHLRRSTAAVGRATCPTTARLPAAARTSRPTRPCI